MEFLAETWGSSSNFHDNKSSKKVLTKFQQFKRIESPWLSTLRAVAEKFSFLPSFIFLKFDFPTADKRFLITAKFPPSPFEYKQAAAVFAPQSRALNKIFCYASGCSSSNLFFTLRFLRCYASTKVCNFNSKKTQRYYLLREIIDFGRRSSHPPSKMTPIEWWEEIFDSIPVLIAFWGRMKSSFYLRRSES